MRPVLILTLLLVVLMSDAQAQTSCGVEAKGYYSQGQPIVMRLMLENKSFESAVVDLGYDREGALEFKLKRGEGDWIELPRRQIREGLARVGKLTIAPQESYSQQIILDDWYKFTEPGKYVVSLKIPKTPVCAALEIPFEVLPMDAEWLSDVCGKLLDTIQQNKNDYAMAADAANVLAKVDNRLVVPFLTKALEANRMMTSILIPALERIGDKDAIHSLISLLEQHDATSAEYELARPALVRLEKRCAPEQVESIAIALARFPAQ